VGLLVLKYPPRSLKQSLVWKLFLLTDDAPAHRVCETAQLLTRETPDFIAPTLWPANSPDLSPVDYQIWGSMSVCNAAGFVTSPNNKICQFPSRFIKQWEYFNQMINRSSLKQSGSDVLVFELAFEHMKNILNTFDFCT